MAWISTTRRCARLLAEQQIAAAQHLAAERDFERRWRQSLEVEISALMHQNRELRKANESWRVKFEDLERTVELPKLPAEPEPKRRGRWRR